MSDIPENPLFKRSPRFSIAKELRGFGPTGLYAIGTILLSGTLLIGRVAVPVGALLVLFWVRFSRTPWQKIGYKKPSNWVKTFVGGILLGCSFKLLTKSVVMPLLGAGPVNIQYSYLSGNKTMLPYAIWMMLVAGWAEETVYRGFLFERLHARMGKGKKASILIILITSFWFGLAHLQSQNVYGAIHSTILGLVFGSIYAARGQLFFLMIVHAAYDLLALVLIYFNLEREVATFFSNKFFLLNGHRT